MAETMKKREEIEAKYKWDLTHIFRDTDAWEEAYNRSMARTEEAAAFDGRVAEDPKGAIRAVQELYDGIMPVFEYAFLMKETDNTDPKAQALKDKAMRLYVTAMTRTAYLQPELLAMPEEALNALMADPEMKDYDAMLRQVLLGKPHTLPKEQERLIAMMGEVAEAPQGIFSALSDADMKFPPVKMPDGTEQELTEGNYSQFIHSENREVRSQAFRNIMNTYASYGNTIAATYSASVKKDQFMALSHHYASAREAAMKPLEIPEEVYDNLISVIHEYLPVLQEYLRLRKKLLKLDELHLYDLYTPMIAGYKMELPYEKAFDLVLEGLRPMGEDYIEKLKEARDGGWIDVFPSPGKSSGAFSAGSLRDVHPYVLLNHNDNLDSAFTIAHELGHSMHSFYSNTNQPSPKSDYSLFVAEVASTCNEAVMLRYLLDHTEDADGKAYLLNYFLEQFRTTVFRQTMFAEFEKISHEMAQQGIPLTRESLSDAYFKLNEQYYGETCFMDPEIASEWMRIPHFYRGFYVYVYATGLCAAVTLSEKILSEGQGAVADYRKFLSAGCSVPPIEALKLAGIDMSKPEPIRRAMEVFRETVRQMKEVTEG
ncbi:MAG: oligoendopeptidase F [Clostridiales bacterium]|nr:oligoendopeptidase F [Clostridiales bacterium]